MRVFRRRCSSGKSNSRLGSKPRRVGRAEKQGLAKPATFVPCFSMFCYMADAALLVVVVVMVAMGILVGGGGGGGVVVVVVEN